MFKNICITIFLLVTVKGNLAVAQYSLAAKEVNPQEAVQMAALCASYTTLDILGDDKALIPDGYKRVYTSPIIGLHNKFQIYRYKERVVINFRGSVNNIESWAGNIYAEMIPAQGIIEIDGNEFNYKLASDSGASVHSGFTLALAFFHQHANEAIQKEINKGAKQIFITGHSQGGALASIYTSYLYYEKNRLGWENIPIKTYTYAAPMVGNKYFANEYNREFASNKRSFSFVNPDDFVPTLPLSYADPNYIDKHLANFISSPKNFNWKSLAKDVVTDVFKDEIEKQVHKASGTIQAQLSNFKVPIKMPNAIKEVNYVPLENRHEFKMLPVVLFDKVQPKNEDSNAIWEKGEAVLLNHSSIGYYESLLQLFYPNKYKTLQKQK